MDAPLLAIAAQTRLVKAVTEGVEDVALDHIAHGDGNRLAGVGHGCTADEAVGRSHGHGTDEVVTEVLSDLKGDGLGNSLEGHLDGQCVVQCRQPATRKLHVDDRTDDTHHTAGGSRRLCVLLLQSCSHNLVTFCAFGERPSATDDLCDFLGNLRLTCLVGHAREVLDQLGRVVSCRLHCGTACGGLGG